MNDAPARSRRPEWSMLTLLMIGHAVTFFAFYPPIQGIEDEVGFINQALVWSAGAISAEGAGYHGDELGDFQPVDGRTVAARHPGRSLVALPFLMAGGVPAVFASGLLLHLAAAVVAALLLARLGRSPLWAALVLFHPTLSIYSRTMLADGAAGGGLLLAGLAATLPTGAGVGAGLAVALAAAMRYHAGMVLPIVAGSLAAQAGRDRPRREAALCLLAGSLGGGLIVLYNLAVYHAPVDPFSARRGLFSAEFLVPQAAFYATCLMVLWPGMLLAPLLDRSPIRWMVRGVCAFYFVLFSFYYFHDRAPGWVETIVVGQRLIQVALPLWVVSYAGVVDDRVAGPIRRRLGDRTFAALAVAGCLGLLGGNALMFARHQEHLGRLRQDRDALAAAIPEGALLIQHGGAAKLFGVPVDLPVYRWRAIVPGGMRFDHGPEIAGETRPWYIVFLRKFPGEAMPPEGLEMVGRYRMRRVDIDSPRFEVYEGQPVPAAAAPTPAPSPEPQGASR